MNPRTVLLRISAAIVLAALPASASAQINDFEDGTTQGWQTNLLGMGGASQPVVQAGGYGGPADDYLLITSFGGTGPGSRLNIINPTGWAGNYLTNGVTGFSARLINLGTTDLYLRILFEDPGPMTPPANIAYLDDPFFLPAGGGWTDAFFSASPVALLAGLGSVEGALANTTTLRLFHSFADTFPNPGGGIEPITAQLGLDDFRAVGSAGAVPEPSTWAMLIAGFALVGGAMRARRGNGTRARATA
jgi:hypothetical protein